MNAALKRIFPVVERSSFRLPVRTERNSFRSSARIPRPRRSGISLIEVLIAVFVLTFGLMGIAMVIPAGRYLMVEAAKSDRGSACGRAALNDMKIRGWLDPLRWKQIRGARAHEYGTQPSDGIPLPVGRYGGIIYGETFLVDPVFFQIARAAGTETVQFFPYTTPTSQQPQTRPWPHRALARRVTPNIPRPVAERITTWADELVFSLEGEEQRPRQLFQWDDGSGWAFPVLPGDNAAVGATNYRIRAENEGSFTWAAMVAPVVPPALAGSWEDTDTPGVTYPMISVNSITRYEVSIVVFYRRDFYCPTSGELTSNLDPETVRERSVYAEVSGGGIGGGDVRLFINGVDNLPDSYLNVRKNQWIMLKALDRAGRVGNWHPAVFKWYRVVGVSEVEPATIKDPMDLSKELQGRGRYVTLAGPDWQIDTTIGPSAAFDPQTDIAEAAIIDDVVGVYTTIVDMSSL